MYLKLIEKKLLVVGGRLGLNGHFRSVDSVFYLVLDLLEKETVGRDPYPQQCYPEIKYLIRGLYLTANLKQSGDLNNKKSEYRNHQ